MAVAVAVGVGVTVTLPMGTRPVVFASTITQTSPEFCGVIPGPAFWLIRTRTSPSVLSYIPRTNVLILPFALFATVISEVVHIAFCSAVRFAASSGSVAVSRPAGGVAIRSVPLPAVKVLDQVPKTYAPAERREALPR